VTSIEEMSLNRLWAAPKLPRLSFNQLAVSGCTVAVPSDQLGRRRAGGQPRHTRRGLSMMVTIRQTPSAGGRFPVARRPRVWGGAGIAGAPPRRRQETDRQERAGHARYAAGGGERDEGVRRRAACAGTRTDPLAKGHAAASWARDYLAGTPCAVPGRARESRTRAYQGTAHALHPPSRGRQRPPVRVVGQFDAGS